MSDKKKELTVLERSFLEHLFGEALGNPKLAMKMAGYGENNSVAQITRQLRQEIIEMAEITLAGASPKAVLGLIGVIDDPNALGNKSKIAAAKEILDRAGLVKPDSDVNLKIPSGGVIILPAKGRKIEEEVEEIE